MAPFLEELELLQRVLDHELLLVGGKAVGDG